MVDCRYLRSYILDCVITLRLAHWEFNIEHDEALSDYCNVTKTIGTQEGFLTVGPEFWKATARRKRELVAHELVHIHLWDIADIAKRMAEQLCDEVTYRAISVPIDAAEELATDNLARAIAPLLPVWTG